MDHFVQEIPNVIDYDKRYPLQGKAATAIFHLQSNFSAVRNATRSKFKVSRTISSDLPV